MRASAGIIFRNEKQELFMVQPTYKPYWDIPGGIVEEGESPQQALIREMKEEIKFSYPIGRLLVVDALSASKSYPTSIHFVFDGGRKDSGLFKPLVNNSEIKTWEWCGSSQILTNTELAPIFRKRLLSALGAAQRETTLYLENGIPCPLRYL